LQEDASNILDLFRKVFSSYAYKKAGLNTHYDNIALLLMKTA